jgi:23S rRNA pseudouridine1911/1915/1917 synthase
MADPLPAESRQIAVESASRRLDSYVAGQLHVGRAEARRLIEEGLVEVEEGSPVRPSMSLRPGMRLTVASRPAVVGPPVTLVPRVVYDDDEIVVVDKPAGLVVHPAPGHRGPTLVDTLPAIGGRWSAQAGDERPGIVHRLDRGTSGLLVLARTDQAHQGLARQLRERTMGREYWAMVIGSFEEDRGRVDAPVGRDRQQPRRMAVSAEGRPAGTEFFVLERLAEHTTLRLRLLSGRTHQIRVHLAYIGHPLVGDGLYATASTGSGRPALHAAMLHLRHPGDGREMVFCSRLPTDLVEASHRLGGATPPVWPWEKIPEGIW